MIESDEIKKQSVFRDAMIGLESSLCNNYDWIYQFRYKGVRLGGFNK